MSAATEDTVAALLATSGGLVTGTQLQADQRTGGMLLILTRVDTPAGVPETVACLSYAPGPPQGQRRTPWDHGTWVRQICAPSRLLRALALSVLAVLHPDPIYVCVPADRAEDTKACEIAGYTWCGAAKDGFRVWTTVAPRA